MVYRPGSSEMAWELRADPRALPRGASRVPGSIGLHLYRGIPMQVKAAKGKRNGITVHSASKITAKEWVKKIRASSHIPAHYQKQIKARKDLIYVTSTTRFKVPNNVIRKSWLGDWLSAFMNSNWEMTTGELQIVVKKSGSPKITVTTCRTSRRARASTASPSTR